MNFQIAPFTEHIRPTASRVSLVNVNKLHFSKEILNRKVYFLCNVLGKNLQVFLMHLLLISNLSLGWSLILGAIQK